MVAARLRVLPAVYCTVLRRRRLSCTSGTLFWLSCTSGMLFLLSCAPLICCHSPTSALNSHPWGAPSQAGGALRAVLCCCVPTACNQCIVCKSALPLCSRLGLPASLRVHSCLHASLVKFSAGTASSLRLFVLTKEQPPPFYQVVMASVPHTHHHHGPTVLCAAHVVPPRRVLSPTQPSPLTKPQQILPAQPTNPRPP